MSEFRALRLRSRRPADPDLAPLRVRSCRDLCEWNRTPVERRGEPMFACRGCGSQWVPSEQWTPRDSNGAVPPEVLDIVAADP
ncbi:hypothetical protein [Dietzia sp. PP-33]|jgi:hypothetical protein|uniref:hypothetical protein n=1 Tax=Dietzia sp. PP-33 TaxID=2957500 RepID=UPI0029AA0F71|nr:hypothetical protein [Dietzia sp. PP-33]MDX2355317.1 hypothetical protein [Dietzia sp. PP-33]